MKNYKLFLIGIVVMAILLQLASFFLKPNSSSKADSSTKNSLSKFVSVQIGETAIKAELASTSEQITAGLSNREKLEEGNGMYFVLGGKGSYTFWMKDMRFPIDIIWIDSGKIVGIEKSASVPNGSEVPTYPSPVLVTNVLEVNAGVAEANGWSVGNEVIVSD